MGMTEHSFAYEAAQSYEERKLRVLDGSAAKARADARRFDSVRLALGVIAILVYLLGVAFVEAKITTAGVEVNQLKADIAATEAEIAKADLTIGAKASLERIESYAALNLGMVYPEAGNVHFLDEQSSLTIAAGKAALSGETVVAAEEAAADGGLWEGINQALASLLPGTALAAADSGAAAAGMTGSPSGEN